MLRETISTNLLSLASFSSWRNNKCQYRNSYFWSRLFLQKLQCKIMIGMHR